MTKTGRNDLCPCGSGRKFKKCCEAKTPARQQSRVLMIVVGAAVIGGLAVAATSFRSGGGGSVRIWDPAHGHYHNAQGVQVP